MNLVVLGLILDIIGVLILVVVSILNPHYSRREDLKWWDKKRYSWLAWRPIFKIWPKGSKPEWKLKSTHWVIVYGIIPPKHQWNVIGFLFILEGFLLQLKFYLV